MHVESTHLNVSTHTYEYECLYVWGVYLWRGVCVGVCVYASGDPRLTAMSSSIALHIIYRGRVSQLNLEHTN